MFILANGDGRFVMLRCCECGKNVFIETDKFKTITHDYVILKDDTKITCENCGASQPQEERHIPLEPQTIREEFLTPPKSKLPFWVTRTITTEELLRTIDYD